MDNPGGGGSSGPPRGAILVVDDDARMLRATSRNLKLLGYEVATAQSATQARAMLERRRYSGVLSDLKLYVEDGTAFAAWASRVYRDTPIVVMTGERDVRVVSQELGTARVWGVLAKPFGIEALEGGLANAVEQGELISHQQAREARAVASALLRAQTALDQHAGMHALRVARWSWALGARLQRPHDERPMFELGGLLHDVGKLAVPRDTLQRRGKLSDEDWRLLREHPRHGSELVAGVQCLAEVRDAIHYHHERWDGSGYPCGLTGEQIPLLARVVSVAEAYDAITSDSSYQEPRPYAAAAEELVAGAGSQFDPTVVEAFTGIERQEWLEVCRDLTGSQPPDSRSKAP